MSTSSKTSEVIGIAGTFASGKDTLVDYLVKKYNYFFISTSDLVRQEAMALHGSIERPILFKTAQELRKSRGAGVLCDIAIERYEEAKQAQEFAGVVISGLRSLGEAKVIHKHDGILAFVDAPAEVRHKRMQSRRRDSETELTLEEFLAGEQAEWYAGPEDSDFNLRDIKKMSDIVIENQYSLDEFFDVSETQLGLK